MNKKGFTLIEFLIYISIVGFLVGALSLSGINIMYGRAEIRASEEVEENGRFSLQKITTYIRNADNIKSISTDSLSLNLNESGTEYVDFYLNTTDQEIMISHNGDPAEPLTSERVLITDLNFTETYTDAIQVSMIVKFDNPSETREYELEKIFRTMEMIRKKSWQDIIMGIYS